MKRKIGMIGFSPGNGHPYSFSAIINGCNIEYLKDTEWNVIYNYLKPLDYTEFQFEHIKITHIWTQSKSLSEEIARFANIQYVCETLEELERSVDAVIIARDDHKSHYRLAKPFLDSGKIVFIDKPLTLNKEELEYFKPYILKGQLMSLSGMRYARELDELRADKELLKETKMIHTVGISDWDRYAIHLIDATLPLLSSPIESVTHLSDYSFLILLKNKTSWYLHINKSIAPCFEFTFYTSKSNHSIQVKDNFTMFKRSLKRFERMVSFNEIPDDQNLTLDSIQLLIMMKESMEQNEKLYWGDF